jgi:hypothetical protein
MTGRSRLAQHWDVESTIAELSGPIVARVLPQAQRLAVSGIPPQALSTEAWRRPQRTMQQLGPLATALVPAARSC